MRIQSIQSDLCRKIWSRRRLFTILGIVLLCMYVGTWIIANRYRLAYEKTLSVVTYDRNHTPIVTRENVKGHYAYPLTSIPPEFTKLLLKKEDAHFYVHPGINPFSTIRALINLVQYENPGGASTITQQLTKNILRTESDRTFWNKVRESIGAISLELHTSKKEILLMYANSVYLGNQIQGFETGSRVYFNKPLNETSSHEQLALLATLSHPSTRNPWKEKNEEYAEALHNKLALTGQFFPPITTKEYTLQHPSSFELSTAHITCNETCTTTLDTKLNEALRDILNRHIMREYERGARNGAIIVITADTEELLAFVGSPDPKKDDAGAQINMALEPRPIGSTVKPFIYLKGFMEGLRPYTKVDDREYKYPIATGFSLYPKNFDGTYRGEVTLHEALSNSLNVPSVKVLEYIGLSSFYQFLGETLNFIPIQPYDQYQYGIALGGLEMDLLTLTHYFSVFPRGGTIAPLRVYSDSTPTPRAFPPQSSITETTMIAPSEYTELVHAIISDRLTGVEQFGLKSNLNLTIPSYGVKTGTSRDFHDSWVVGYTNDYIVGVWVGNSENEALDQVTGQGGAGAIWHDTMEYLAETPYYTDTRITLDHIARIPLHNSLEWGLRSDRAVDHETLLIDTRLITSPHDGDTYENTGNTILPLESHFPVTWKANGKLLETEATTTRFIPKNAGVHEIEAYHAATGKTERINITLLNLE